MRLFWMAVCWVCVAQLGAQNLDVRLLDRLNSGSAPGWDRAMLVTSYSAYPLVAATPVHPLMLGYMSRENRYSRERKLRIYRRTGWSMAAGMGATLGLTVALKEIVRRPRPYDAYPDLIDPKMTEGSFSFPSGHTAMSFSSATALTLAYRRWYIAVPAYAWAGTVAYSRMRLGVHYPSDVLVGAALGIGTTWLTWKLTERWRNPKWRSARPMF